MESELRRLHRWSWLFIAGGAIRAMLLPIAGAVLASGGLFLSWPALLSLALVVPALVYALIRQRFYSYRFTDSELVVRDGLLTRNTRTIPYERIHNVALARNPIHRLLGVTTARVETAAGGSAEATLRVVSPEAAEELRRYALADARSRSGEESDDAPLLQVPDRELVRLGLISNRGFLVVAAAAGLLSQVQWWELGWLEELDWTGLVERLRDAAPGWAARLFDAGTWVVGLVLALLMVLMLVVVIRLLSIVWYLVRYRGFTLQQREQEIRADYGVWPEVSSVIPAHRIQLVTISASLLARWSDRASIDVETAGAVDSGASAGNPAAGVVSSRQWLAPIVETARATGLVRRVLPEIEIEGLSWQPIESRAVRRIVTRIAIALVPITAGVAALFVLTPLRWSGWHALWLPLILLTAAWLISREWVRRAGYALTDQAIYFRSGWLSRNVSAVRFVNVQTASLSQSPFDLRRNMASIAVDTAGAGGLGHRIAIPFLDLEVAHGILRRLYDETRATEFRW